MKMLPKTPLDWHMRKRIPLAWQKSLISRHIFMGASASTTTWNALRTCIRWGEDKTALELDVRFQGLG